MYVYRQFFSFFIEIRECEEDVKFFELLGIVSRLGSCWNIEKPFKPPCYVPKTVLVVHLMFYKMPRLRL